MADLENFDIHRNRLFAIAYRMLGSVHDAEDVVQDAYLRWAALDHEMVQNPQALLCTMVTRMSIDTLRSARRRRETYVGEWLPEPLVDGPSASDNVALAESLSVAFLLLLERLNPVERAAFLLREAFDYSYADMAAVLEKSEDNCRQIVRRARDRVQRPKPRYVAASNAQQALLDNFMIATQAGSMETLLNLLAEDAVMHSDHGGKAHAARRAIYGADRIARFFIGVARRFVPENPSIRFVTINGAPGVITYSGQVPDSAFSLEIEDGKIRQVYVIRNPDKLKRLPGPVGQN